MRLTKPYTLTKRTLQSGVEVFYYRYRKADGTRSGLISTGIEVKGSEQRARKQANLFVMKLYKDGLLIPKTTTTFRDYAKDFFTENCKYIQWKRILGTDKTEGISKSTIDSYHKILKYQLLPYFENKPVESISVSEIKTWMIWCSDQWSHKTINNAKSVLSIILTTAVEDTIIEINPCLGIEKLKTDKVDRVLLTVPELSALFAADWKNETAKKAALTAVITGMRIGEILALEKRSIFDNYIDLQHSWSSKHGLGSTKTKEIRKVPIPHGFSRILTDAAGSRFIFQQIKNVKPIHAKTVNENFYDILDMLKIDRVGRKIDVHSFRRLFISYLQSENVSESKIRAAVGHHDGSMTGLYTYWTPDMFPEIYTAQEKLLQRILT